LRFSKAIARFLVQKKILYSNTSWGYDEFGPLMKAGKSIEEIIELEISERGVPLRSLKEAIKKYYIVDDLDNPLEDFEGDIVEQY